MPEETAAAPPATTTEPAAPPQDRTVPYDRFVEVNNRAKDAEKELKDLQGRLSELEDRDKSEVERERNARTRAEQEATELQTRVTRLERGGWVRNYAAEAGFEDPGDAVAYLDVSQIESEKDAERAVKDLAKRKKYLLRNTEERPQIGQVLQNGQPVTAPQEAQMSEADQTLLSQIKGTLEQGWTSTPAF